MLVRAKRAQPLHKGAQPTPREPAQAFNFPAPIAGWAIVGDPMNPIPRSAKVLDNWICTTTGIQARGGKFKHATLGAAATSVFSYRSGGNEKLFGATAADIFDITTPADPDVAETAVASALTAGNYSVEQFGTAGGDYLYAVNGTDYAQIYDGTDWNPVTDEALYTLSYDALSADFTVGETLTGGTSGATAEIHGVRKSSSTAGTLLLGAITGTFQDNEALTDSDTGSATEDGTSAAGSTLTISGVATTALSAVWVHSNRLWFVEKNTTSAWYLAVDSIAGTATEYPLAGIFGEGGSLLFGAAWSLDAGDGMDDKCIFVSDQGEVAVYSGTDPSSGTTWGLQGVYKIPRPLGKNSWIKTGGDVLVATKVGLVPISASIQKDVEAVEAAAVSKNIAPYWQDKAGTLSETWEMVKVPDKNILVVSQPGETDEDGTALCANLQTGAWSRFTGWETSCVAVYNDQGYFGDSDGAVWLMDSGGIDDASAYTCTYIGQFESLGQFGVTKTAVQARATFTAASPVNYTVSILADFDETIGAAPGSVSEYTTDTWDSGVWDTAIWDAAESYTSSRTWAATGNTGVMLAPAIQATFGVTPTPVVKYAGMDVQFTVGDIVT